MSESDYTQAVANGINNLGWSPDIPNSKGEMIFGPDCHEVLTIVEELKGAYQAMQKKCAELEAENQRLSGFFRMPRDFDVNAHAEKLYQEDQYEYAERYRLCVAYKAGFHRAENYQAEKITALTSENEKLMDTIKFMENNNSSSCQTHNQTGGKMKKRVKP